MTVGGSERIVYYSGLFQPALQQYLISALEIQAYYNSLPLQGSGHVHKQMLTIL